VPEALRIYDKIRRPFARSVLEGSRRAGLMYEFNWPGFTDGDIIRQSGTDGDLVNEDTLQDLGKSLEELQSWAWLTTIDADRAQVINMFEEYVKNKYL